MNIETTLQIESTSSVDTERIGELLGKNVRGGEVIELQSDLGGGKTTLVRGLAKGVGSTDTVASPSFTIQKVYKTERLAKSVKGVIAIQHFDFYRLGAHPEQMAHELEEAMLNKANVVVLEWARAVEQMLPQVRVRVSIGRVDETTRNILITCPIQLFYLVEGIDGKIGTPE